MSMMEIEDDESLEELLEKVKQKEEILRKLKLEIAKQDEINHARSIVARANSLHGKFTLDVQVVSITHHPDEVSTEQVNRNGDYILYFNFSNKSGLYFPTDLWFLQVSVSQGNGWKFTSFHLAEDWDKSVIRESLKLTKIKSHQKLDVRFNLVTKLQATMGLKFIPIGHKIIDASYFFYSIPNGLHLDEPMRQLPALWCDVSAKQLWLFHNRPPCTYTLSLPSGLEAAQVWRRVLANCMASNQMQPSRCLLYVYIGDTRVQLRLDNECSKLELQCRDVRVLHSVKQAVIQLLAMKKAVEIPKMLLNKAKRNSYALLQSGDVTFDAAKSNWREEVTALLPI